MGAIGGGDLIMRPAIPGVIAAAIQRILAARSGGGGGGGGGAGTATWNPADKSAGIVLSNGNLTASAPNDSQYESVFCTVKNLSSGKYYWEIYIEVCSTPGDLMCGFRRDSDTLNQGDSWNTGTFGYWRSNGVNANNLTGNGTGVATYSGGSPYGTIQRYALDMDNKKAWLGDENGWFNSGDPAAGTNPQFTSIPANSFGPHFTTDNSAGAEQVTLNCGITGFVFTAPTGFNKIP